MHDTSTYDVAIIGGGLAGLSLAIQSADNDYKTILFEKEEYPFHKVCGEYISMESLGFLKSLGFPYNDLALPTINQLSVSDAKGTAYDFELPLGGFGISRFMLDNLLYKIALQKGVTVLTATKVDDVIYNNDLFIITSGSTTVTAKVTAGCFGKRSNIDVKWKRSFAEQKAGADNNFIGVKYHIRYVHPHQQIVLHNFSNGYCGMSKIEDDKSCLCYMTTAENLRRCNNSISQLEKEVLQKNQQLKKIFSTAEFLYDRPLTISQINFSKKEQVQNHVLMIGDAAGLISPLCGNGMSMALHSSKIAFTYMNAYLQKKINRQQMEEQYTSNWKKTFKMRLLVGRKVQALFGGDTTTSFLLKSLHYMPAIANRLIKATHGKPF